MNRSFALKWVLCIAGTSGAQIWPERVLAGIPVRELVVHSETVVVAAPADPTTPARYKALRVLLGTAIKEEDIFEIDDLSSYDITIPAAENSPARKPARAPALLICSIKRCAWTVASQCTVTMFAPANNSFPPTV